MTSSERCLVCGAALRDDTTFCVSCGMPRPIATPDASAEPLAFETTESSPAAAPMAAAPEPVASETPAMVEPEPTPAPTPEPAIAEAPAPVATTPTHAPTPVAHAATPAPVAHAAMPEFKLTGGRAAIGPLVLVIALAIFGAVVMWIQAGYPLPTGWGQ